MQKHSNLLAYTFTDVLDRRLGLDLKSEDLSQGTPRWWLQKILTCKSNKEYKSLLLDQENIVKDLHEFIQKGEYDLDSIKTFILSKIQDDDIELTLIILWTIFTKENKLGQSVYTQYVEETKCPIDQTGPLPEFEFDSISNKNETLQNMFLYHYLKDGETIYERTQFLILFYAIETITNYWVQREGESGNCLLWKARFAFTYSDILTYNVVYLKDASLDCYSRYVSQSREALREVMDNETVTPEEKTWCQRNVAMLLSEYSYCLIQFWKYEACEESIKEAFDLLGLDLFLAG